MWQWYIQLCEVCNQVMYIIQCIYNTSSQSACLQSFFSGYNHQLCGKFNYCVCIITYMHWVEERMYNSFIAHTHALTLLLCHRRSSCLSHATAIGLIYFFCFPHQVWEQNYSLNLLANTWTILHNMYTLISSFMHNSPLVI